MLIRNWRMSLQVRRIREHQQQHRAAAAAAAVAANPFFSPDRPNCPYQEERGG